MPTTGFRTIPSHCGQIAAAPGKVADFLRCHDRGCRRDIPLRRRQRYAADALRSAAHPAASPQQLRAPCRLHVCAVLVSEQNREKKMAACRLDAPHSGWQHVTDKTKARPQQPGFTFSLKSRRRYFAAPTLPNWLSNGL
jgi:hypothetical protein